jgi:hypothetical protein
MPIIPETSAAAQERKVRFPRLLIRAVFYARAIELNKRQPLSFGEIDLADQGNEAMVKAVLRYHMVRHLGLMRPSELRRTQLIDLAIFMTEIAKPCNVFLAEARQTSIDVASRLLRYEGWSPAPESFSEWRERALAIDPASSNAAKEHLALLGRYWGWEGRSTGLEIDAEQVANVIVISDNVLGDLARRCA